ncbi:unnamed protein product [Xylocopa violacea]|uniref:Large ribosomal subunit protein uL23m n=1 Tax=Xylocopa violacea TaxID=135666 RepID=A0ABP1NGG0_XYLVO
MSTRFYPLYQPGNPQLRIFLPNFWMKLVKPETNQPKNIVQFHCSMEMTKHDIKNYLEKIYNVYPIQVRTRIALGKTNLRKPFLGKEDDMKIAYVVLPRTEQFTFPDLSADDEESKHRKRAMEFEEETIKSLKLSKLPGFPTWFRG